MSTRLCASTRSSQPARRESSLSTWRSSLARSPLVHAGVEAREEGGGVERGGRAPREPRLEGADLLPVPPLELGRAGLLRDERPAERGVPGDPQGRPESRREGPRPRPASAASPHPRGVKAGRAAGSLHARRSRRTAAQRAPSPRGRRRSPRGALRPARATRRPPRRRARPSCPPEARRPRPCRSPSRASPVNPLKARAPAAAPPRERPRARGAAAAARARGTAASSPSRPARRATARSRGR